MIANNQPVETTLDRIAAKISKLDRQFGSKASLDDIEEQYMIQSDTIGEIKDLLSETRQLKSTDQLKDKNYVKQTNKIAGDEYESGEKLDYIERRVDKLDKDLAKLVDADSRPKAWFEQKKAIHEIKKILNDLNKYAEYEVDELKDYEKLL